MVNSFFVFNTPRHCALCGFSSSLDLCAACDRDLPRIKNACSHCGVPLEHDSICGRCLTASPRFARCISPLRYEAPVSHLLGAFKYHGDFNNGRILTTLLVKRLCEESALAADVIVPVPLHWRRRWNRGFNQAELIGDELSRSLHLPMQTRWLHRTRASAPQQSLSADARRSNLRNAFSCRLQLNGMHIAVVDDVVTTGATANAIAEILLACGAASVQIWCLARTP
ncbi:MAG TPA: double zinc ribbon domain-containing protein [Spongiibacteraceae bacterium]|jgi:ComF family protein